MQQTGSKFVTSGGFNVIFSVLSHFRKDVLRPELKQMAVDICCSGTSDLVKAVDSFLCSGEFFSWQRNPSMRNEFCTKFVLLSSADPAGCQPDDRQELATRMKMVAYLLCQLVEMTEAEVMHNESASQATGSRGRKGNAAASKKTVVMDGGDDEESGSWEARRQEAVTLLFRLLSLNLNALFDPPLIEEEFINLLGNCLFRLLENPGVALQRSKDVRMSIFQAMGLMNAKYNYSLSCRLKMVQSLKLYEHLVVRTGRTGTFLKGRKISKVGGDSVFSFRFVGAHGGGGRHLLHRVQVPHHGDGGGEGDHPHRFSGAQQGHVWD